MEGYTDQATIVCEEFCPQDYNESTLVSVLNLHHKPHARQTVERIILISNQVPREWYGTSLVLGSRVHCVKHFIAINELPLEQLGIDAFFPAQCERQ